jgi:hypothetical protein
MAIEISGHDEVEHPVPEELQALVVFLARAGYPGRWFLLPGK